MRVLVSLVFGISLSYSCTDKKKQSNKSKQKNNSDYQWSNSEAGKKICTQIVGKKRKMVPLEQCIDLGIGEYQWVKNDFGVKSCVYAVKGGISNPIPISACENNIIGWFGRMFSR